MPPTPAKHLIADPGLTSAHRLRGFLVAEGVDPDRIRVAYTAEETLRLFREHHPEVVFLGLDLPDMGGVEVARTLWKEDPGVDLVVTSARRWTDPRVRRVLEMGARSLLEKPVRREDVGDLLAGFRDDGDDPDRSDAHLVRIPPPA